MTTETRQTMETVMNTNDNNTAQVKTLLLAGATVAPFFYGVAIV
jgi:hypothetical protein